jgi:hypothetical protein
MKTVAIELIVSMLLPTAAWPTTQNPDQPLVTLLDVPPLTDCSIRVEVALAITDLVEVDEAHEQFRVSGLTIASWNDARLAFNPRDPVNSFVFIARTRSGRQHSTCSTR